MRPPRPPTVEEVEDWLHQTFVFQLAPAFGINGVHMGWNDNDGPGLHLARPEGDAQPVEE